VDTGYEEELALIFEMVSEHLAWEARLGGVVLPAIELPPEAVAPRNTRTQTQPKADPIQTTSPGIVASQDSSTNTSEPAEATAFVKPADGLPMRERVARLTVLAEEAARCTRCVLHEGRTKSVFARGNPESPIVFVGEGPGYNEDQEGLPFVGAAGQLLDRMISAMGFARDEVYICNVVKCRPPDNRTPTTEEAKACEMFLVPQLEIVAPKVIVALGRTAAENLGCLEPGRAWRGVWRAWRGIPVMPTYHPAFLLRSPEMKKPVWEDLQNVLARLGRTPPLAKKPNEG
jgi:DNA polymerase